VVLRVLAAIKVHKDDLDSRHYEHSRVRVRAGLGIHVEEKVVESALNKDMQKKGGVLKNP
jgi:hypothetical protein